MGMDRRSLGLFALGTLGLVSCTGGDEILLGRVEPSAEAGQEDAAGQAADSSDAGESRHDAASGDPSDPHTLRTCDQDIAGKPALEVYVRVNDATCTKPCSLQLDSIQVAPDASVWVSGSMGARGRERLWIGHYDSEGASLGSAIVDDGGQRGALAVDDHGQAWLLAGVFEPDPRHSYLHRFDQDAHEIGVQVLAGGYTDLVSYPGHGVLLSGYADPLAIAALALSYEGDQLWRRTDDQGRSGRIAVDPTGTIVVGSSRDVGAEDDSGVALDWLTDDGDRSLGSVNTMLSIEGESYFNLAFDADAQLTVVATVPEPFAPPARVGPFKSQMSVERIDLAQGTRWRWQIDGPSGLASTTDKPSGTILVAGPGPRLAAISPDGESCRRFVSDAPAAFDSIASGPNGEIWFAGLVIASSGALESAFGRLERPDLRW